MTDTESRLADLERRAAWQLEDDITLYQSLSTYGHSIGSMEFDEALNLWTEDGVYDLGDGSPELDGKTGAHHLTGPEDIGAMLDGPTDASTDGPPGGTSCVRRCWTSADATTCVTSRSTPPPWGSVSTPDRRVGR